MFKSLWLFTVITLSSMSVFATEPPTDSTAMFDCAVYSGLAKLDNQKTYITAGIFLYDNEHGKKAWSTWSNSPAGATWINTRKAAVVGEINEWGLEGEAATIANFQQKVKGCDIRYGIIDSKTDLKAMGKKLGYIKSE